MPKFLHSNTPLAARTARCLAGLLVALALLLTSQMAGAQASSPLADELVPPLPEEVPEVVGMKLDQARASLERAGFTVRATPKFTYYVGQHHRVFAQSPRGGSAIHFKLPVIQLSYYDKDYQPRNKAAEAGGDQSQTAVITIQVPDVEGYDLEDAIGLLRRAGLSLEIEDEMDTEEMDQDGVVYYQEPAAYSRVEPGSLIKVGIYNYMDAPKTLRQRQLFRERLGLPPPFTSGLPAQEEEEDTQEKKGSGY